MKFKPNDYIVVLWDVLKSNRQHYSKVPHTDDEIFQITRFHSYYNIHRLNQDVQTYHSNPILLKESELRFATPSELARLRIKNA